MTDRIGSHAQPCRLVWCKRPQCRRPTSAALHREHLRGEHSEIVIGCARCEFDLDDDEPIPAEWANDMRVKGGSVR
jgi:hypothetical protein